MYVKVVVGPETQKKGLSTTWTDNILHSVSAERTMSLSLSPGNVSATVVLLSPKNVGIQSGDHISQVSSSIHLRMVSRPIYPMSYTPRQGHCPALFFRDLTVV